MSKKSSFKERERERERKREKETEREGERERDKVWDRERRTIYLSEQFSYNINTGAKSILSNIIDIFCLIILKLFFSLSLNC